MEETVLIIIIVENYADLIKNESSVIEGQEV